jgi:hypothetical protein
MPDQPERYSSRIRHSAVWGLAQSLPAPQTPSAAEEAAMISQGVRMMLLVGLVISAVVAPGTMIAASGKTTLHHQPIPCGPDC